MCSCASCKATNKARAWPVAVSRRQITAADVRLRADPVYAAHWRHCSVIRKGPTYIRSPFPCTGTPQTDGRDGYSFPGGQVGKVRVLADKKPWKGRPNGNIPAIESPREYVAAFCKANNLT